MRRALIGIAVAIAIAIVVAVAAFLPQKEKVTVAEAPFGAIIQYIGELPETDFNTYKVYYVEVSGVACVVTINASVAVPATQDCK